MKLYRPVGTDELKLIKKSGMTKFPPRLPDQSIFYPVLNKNYASQIAKEWNTKSAPGYAGFVTEFVIDDDYISKFEVKTVGAFRHKEYWVPAEKLEEFNNHIIGTIKVVEAYYGENYKGAKDEVVLEKELELKAPVIESDSLEIFSLKNSDFDKQRVEMHSPEVYQFRNNPLQAIEALKSGDRKLLKSEKWLMYLTLTTERNINLERLNSLEEAKNNYVLNYVEKTLRNLADLNLSKYQNYILEETLKWAEVAKSGLAHQRAQWIKSGYNLFAHNIGSAQIYYEQTNETDTELKSIIHDLILTHGLIGQYIRGEIPLSDNKPLYQLVIDNKLPAEDLREILLALNFCIIAAVDESIWLDIKQQVEAVIDLVIAGRFDKQYEFRERIRHLRQVSIKNGENFEAEFDRILSDSRLIIKMAKLLDKVDLWYVEAALYDFSFEEFIKVFMLIYNKVDCEKIKHISFERFMKGIYYQHDGKKRVNIYKKRIIEKYLSEITMEDIIEGRFKENPHVIHEISFHEDVEDTIFFDFKFSAAGSKLIDFCIEAEKSDVLYESAIILLFDLFGLRKDKYDRFYEEESYLQTMNQTIDYKKVILDYITGNSIIDIGPGGGALMDLITQRFPQKKVLGVDIAQNVLDSLKKKKQLENRSWDVLYGDALNLSQYIEKGQVDTIIFCSILHELFSYIEYNGRKFNHETLAAAFKSAFEILPPGGRIIIRDGIMTEPVDQKRIIRFLSEEGIEFLTRYANDFKGRQIEYSVVGQNEVLMPVNDAMEFLYTYTWGEKSYVHEVNEQFGYFTPSGFREFITKVLGVSARIVEFKHFLQEGYTIALSNKIEFFDEKRNPVRLPDSTCIVVIEKC
jgi:SAM-dependent methyltransferase